MLFNLSRLVVVSPCPYFDYLRCHHQTVSLVLPYPFILGQNKGGLFSLKKKKFDVFGLVEIDDYVCGSGTHASTEFNSFYFLSLFDGRIILALERVENYILIFYASFPEFTSINGRNDLL